MLLNPSCIEVIGLQLGPWENPDNFCMLFAEANAKAHKLSETCNKSSFKLFILRQGNLITQIGKEFMHTI